MDTVIAIHSLIECCMNDTFISLWQSLAKCTRVYILTHFFCSQTIYTLIFHNHDMPLNIWNTYFGSAYKKLWLKQFKLCSCRQPKKYAKQTFMSWYTEMETVVLLFFLNTDWMLSCLSHVKIAPMLQFS